MLEAAGWSALATGTLLIGMALSFQHGINEWWTGLIMAFGAGAIISALAYQLIPRPGVRVRQLLRAGRGGRGLFVAPGAIALALTVAQI